MNECPCPDYSTNEFILDTVRRNIILDTIRQCGIFIDSSLADDNNGYSETEMHLLKVLGKYANEVKLLTVSNKINSVKKEKETISK